MTAAQAIDLPAREWEPVDDLVAHKTVEGTLMTCTRYHFQPGGRFPLHRHEQEQVTYVTRGSLTFTLPDGDHLVAADGLAVIPGGVPHTARAGPEGADLLCVVSPRRSSAGQIDVLEA